MNLWGPLHNLSTSGDALAQLYYEIPRRGAQGASLLEALARHPNCPPKIIRQLLLSVPQAVTENPAWCLLMLEGGILGAQEPVLEQLCVGSLPYSYLELLCQHPNAQVRAQVAEHVSYAGSVSGDLDEALLQKLGTLRRDGRLVWLAREGFFPARLQDYLPHPVVVSPAHCQSFRATRLDPWVEVMDLLSAKSGQKASSEEMLIHYARTHGELVPLLALTVTPSKSVLRELYRSVLPWKRLGIALNPQARYVENWYYTSPLDSDTEDSARSILGYLANDGNRWVRAVARQRLADPSWRLF
ncbi:hypothetical protein [Armatimonas rosea]|uniref:Uncharacterized protein n=1 Tax=Armatimonas rosea TaxID=685828 RepID=A0A7W9W685_ARMRO|nr:hypothetical protein [Armatimonas rosea]MBB6049322.1 hypothetical protein [Armatimonas rosea]